MMHARTIGTLSVIATVAGLSGYVAQAMPADAAAAPARTAPKFVVTACNGREVTRPATFTQFCADYGVVIEHMHWTSWTSHLASGYGTVYEDDNYPSHAAGKIFTVPGVVTFWGSATVKGHPGDDTYTRMTFMFPGKRPAVYRSINGRWVATYPQTQTLGF